MHRVAILLLLEENGLLTSGKGGACIDELLNLELLYINESYGLVTCCNQEWKCDCIEARMAYDEVLLVIALVRSLDMINGLPVVCDQHVTRMQ